VSSTHQIGGSSLKRGPLKEGRRPLRSRTKRPEDAPPWVLGHPIRVASLILLHEKDLSPGQIADALNEDLKTITDHLRQLYDAGCIEFVGHVQKGERNARRAVYRAVARPYVSGAAYRAMKLEERQDLNAVALQWILAEALASHRSGKMSQDKTLCLMSDEPNLDEQAREELHNLLASTWAGDLDTREALEGIQQIAGRAASRLAETGEPGTTVVVALMAFERGRTRRPKSETTGPTLGKSERSANSGC
jgi:DNA-binding transcriptional ArsR family regulator